MGIKSIWIERTLRTWNYTFYVNSSRKKIPITAKSYPRLKQFFARIISRCWKKVSITTSRFTASKRNLENKRKRENTSLRRIKDEGLRKRGIKEHTRYLTSNYVFRQAFARIKTGWLPIKSYPIAIILFPTSISDKRYDWKTRPI